MMKIKFSQEFYRIYKKKIDAKIRKSVTERLEIFKTNPRDESLHNHELRDKWEEYRSIDITADYRAIFMELGEGEMLYYFVTLGTHKQLYTQKKSTN